MNNVQCPLCDNPDVPSVFADTNSGLLLYECPVCGVYSLSEKARHVYYKKFNNNRYILSALSRRAYEFGQNPPSFMMDNIENCLDEKQVPETLIDRTNLILEYIMKKSKKVGDSVIVASNLEYPIAYAKDQNELDFMLESLLKFEFIKRSDHFPSSYILTIAGWSKVEQLYKKSAKGNQCFVAMWFSSEMEDAYTSGIECALLETGYKPLRIDKKEHNDRIDDQIIAEIRRSSLLIADFTGQRGGVYFEAGFAMGLGIPVIWTCNKKHIKRCHFDTNHYNHIVWTSPEELRERLKDRILATVPLDK